MVRKFMERGHKCFARTHALFFSTLARFITMPCVRLTDMIIQDRTPILNGLTRITRSIALVFI